MISTTFCYRNMSVFCSCCLLWITLFFQDAAFERPAWFTQVPPNTLYVMQGQTARLKWVYFVYSREHYFVKLSPKWFYANNNVTYTVGLDNGYDGWKFHIDSNTCPPRLFKPTVRVSRENQATLVIKNVSMADSGIYGCKLAVMVTFYDQTHTTELIVTAARFTQVPPSTLYVVKGQTARLVWSYYVDNRENEFAKLSPRWFFKEISDNKTIGYDNGHIGWKFQISNNTCPPRLISPTIRVSRENQSTLVIKDVIMEDSGIYGCTLALIKHLTYTTNTTELVVTETPKFTIKPNMITTIIEHLDLDVSCTAVGPPSPIVTWLNPGTMETIEHGKGSALLRMSNVNRSQNGTKYECQAFNNPNERPVSARTTVIVYYLPEFTRAPHNTTVNQGHDIILHCQATANPPISSISWQRENNVAIKPGFNQLRNGTLIVPNADRSDVGKYICIARNAFNSNVYTATSHAYVNVNVKCALPDFLGVPTNPQYVSKGETVKFKWTYSVDNRDTEFESFSPLWFFNSQSVLIGGDNGWEFLISNTCPLRLLRRAGREGQATLVIKDVITADSGIYGCTLALKNGNDRTNTTELIVTETPRFTFKPKTITTVTEHEDLSISCTAVGPPSPNVTWSTRITNVPISQGIGTAVLRISKVNRSQNGKTYLCLATNNPNENPIITRTTVVVRYPPEFTRAPHDIIANQGHDIILHCQATANPPSSVSWQRENNAAIKSGFTLLRNGTLIIPNANRSDAGKYICTAKNVFNLKIHTATSDAYVSVKFPPGPPQVTATTIKSTSATISWIKPLYSGNTPITGYKLSIDSGLTINTQYIVRFYAQNDAGYGKAASVEFITRNEGPPGQPIVVVEFINQTSVTLTWSKPEEHGGAITEYTIYKKVYYDSWTQVGKIYSTPLTYTVENLQPGKTYRIIVTATNKFGESVKDDSKANIVVIPDVTTKVPDSGRTTASTAKQPVAMIAAGVYMCVCLLVISLIFNILSVVYFYRIKKRSKKSTEPTYDNVEMAAAAASHENVDPASQRSAEYEPVKQTNTIPSTVNSTYEIPGNQQTSEDHYQQLYTETMQHDPTVQYELLRTQHVTTDQRNDTYEPLRNRPTEYQSLHKYSNA